MPSIIKTITHKNITLNKSVSSNKQVIVGHPLKGDGRGIHVLNFLKAYAPNIHQVITEMWQTVIPKLTAYLEGICRLQLHASVVFAKKLES